MRAALAAARFALEAARDAQARDNARNQGHEWWPVTKRALLDRPSQDDRRAVRRGLLRLSQRAADRLTAVSNVIFAVALLPTVLAAAPPTALTCAATIVALLMLTVVLAHFKLRWGLFWNLACTSMWVILLIQALS